MKYDIVLYAYDVTPIQFTDCDIEYLDENRLMIVTPENKTFVTSMRYLIREKAE